MDAHLEILNWVEADIQRKNLKGTGRSWMTIESIFRAGFLLRYWQFTYDVLAFDKYTRKILRHRTGHNVAARGMDGLDGSGYALHFIDRTHS